MSSNLTASATDTTLTRLSGAFLFLPMFLPTSKLVIGLELKLYAYQSGRNAVSEID
ncbi:MAG: hypothetical protein ACLGGW_03920 [Gammaproteobacteria bacterium]